jgi:tripartite-type tricarboxylate transporter receptor subunit TctC
MKSAVTVSILMAAGLIISSGTAAAQAWPTRPVTIVVTFPPGGSSDIVARFMTAPLQAALGQSFLVDNKPGAGGTIGAAAVSRAGPDGYTLMLSNSAPISISPAMLEQKTYDPVKSFTHVVYLGSVSNVFVLHPTVTARTLPELAAWIKAQTKPVSYGSGGVGSIGHIVGETFKNLEGVRMEHVGYKGSAPMHNDLLNGTLKLAVDTLPQNVPLIKDGRLKAIAVTAPARSPLTPDVPSVLEYKQPKLVAENFLGISGPAGLPAGIVTRLHQVTQKAAADPVISKRLEELGVQGRPMSPAEFTKFVENQVNDWAGPVKASGATLN